MRVGAVEGWVEVRPAGEQEAVERLERLVDPLAARRHDERAPTGALDCLDVRERDERRGELPLIETRRLGIRGDADDRPHSDSSTLSSVTGSFGRPRASRGTSEISSTT